MVKDLEVMLSEYEVTIDQRLESGDLISARYWLKEYTKCINSFQQQMPMWMLIKYATRVEEYEQWLRKIKLRNAMSI